MLADTLAIHEQNFLLACATATPVLFVGIAVQAQDAGPGDPASIAGLVEDVSGTSGELGDIGRRLAIAGLYFCFGGEGAALWALLVDERFWWLDLWAGGGLLLAMVFLILTLQPSTVSPVPPQKDRTNKDGQSTVPDEE